MKTFILSIIVTMITSVAGAQQKSFYDFTVKTIDGKDLPLSTFKGKKVLVVNVASKCGFTPQYAKLEELYEKYGKDDFVVIGFPANNFLHQEPGTNEEIKEFCTLNYGVTFPMMAKISVKGKDSSLKKPSFFVTSEFIFLCARKFVYLPSSSKSLSPKGS